MFLSDPPLDVNEEDEDLTFSLSVGDGHNLVDLGRYDDLNAVTSQHTSDTHQSINASFLDCLSSSEFIVDEECILQLFKSCRKCNRQCVVRKQVKGLQLVINQKCTFCESRWSWTNLPDEDEGDLEIN